MKTIVFALNANGGTILNRFPNWGRGDEIPGDWSKFSEEELIAELENADPDISWEIVANKERDGVHYIAVQQIVGKDW